MQRYCLVKVCHHGRNHYQYGRTKSDCEDGIYFEMEANAQHTNDALQANDELFTQLSCKCLALKTLNCKSFD